MVATTRLGLNKQPVGDNVNTWGGILNDQGLELIDEAFGTETIALSGNLVLSATNFMSNQARNASLIFTNGGLSAAPTVTFPGKEKTWKVINRTGYALSLVVSGSAPLTLPNGRFGDVVSDGTSLTLLEPVAAGAAVYQAIADQALVSAAAAATSAASAAGSRDLVQQYANTALSARDSSIAARDLTVGYRDEAKSYRDQAEQFAAPLVLSPMISQPQPGGTALLTGGALTLAVAGFLPLYPKTQKSIQFQVSANTGFTTLVYDSGVVTTTALSVAVPNAQALFTGGTTYYVRARQTDQDNYTSSWSSITTFVFPRLPVAPTMSAPADGATNVGAQNQAVTFTASAYSHPAGTAQAARRFEVSADNFATIITLAGTVGQASATITSPKDTLAANTPYKVRAVDTDVNGGVAIGTATSFTTVAQFRPNVGDPWGGGFFYIQKADPADGFTYDYVVAPASTQIASVPYAASGSSAATTANAARQSMTNGVGNSANIIANDGGTSAARSCAAVSAGGFNDWHLGARQNMIDMIAALGSTTTVPAFASGGSERIAVTLWISTEGNATQAYGITPTGNNSGDNSKTTPFAARAIRRIRVS